MAATAVVTAREANQQFARLLRQVAQGKEFVVTLRGRPVARLAPVAEDGTRVPTPEQEAAWRMILSMARPLGIGRLDRDELHERR